MTHIISLLTRFFIIASVLVGQTTGCGVIENKKQAEKVEDAGVIRGHVLNSSNHQGAAIVISLRKDNGVFVQSKKLTVPRDGKYQFTLPPGSYLLAAYIDKNYNNKYDKGEYSYFDVDASPIEVLPKQEKFINLITITGLPESVPENISLTAPESVSVNNIGKLSSLNDPIYSQKNYSLGIWHPVDFIQKVGGGLFFLEPYNESKIPVLFVHDIGGGPTDFKKLINNLDKTRYQPCVLYYPGGLSLGLVSDYLTKAISELQAEHQFKKIIIVAHSTGGLVARSFVKKYYEQQPKQAEAIQLFITINSPMLGIDGLSDIDYFPLVIPAWRDLVPNSTFLQGILNWRLPQNTKYHLIFSYLDGKERASVIKQQSQLPYNVQSEAVRLYGFNTDHVGPLQEAKLLEIIKTIIQEETLASVAPKEIIKAPVSEESFKPPASEVSPAPVVEEKSVSTAKKSSTPAQEESLVPAVPEEGFVPGVPEEGEKFPAHI